MKMLFVWQTLDERTWRAKTIGGWIVKSMFNDEDGNSIAMVFVPDPTHQWEIIRS